MSRRRSLFSITDLSYKSLFIIISFLLITIILLARFVFPHQKISAAWFDDAWRYRKAISINNTSGSELTDYQVSLSIGTSDLIASGKMKSDCSDFRITDQNGNLLPFWIETNGLNACNQNNTIVWTKISTIPTSETTLFSYYGNPSALNASNGNDVFLFFDDFNTPNIDINKWKKTGNLLSISTNRLRADRANGTGSLFSNKTFPRPFVLDYDFYPTQYPTGWEGSYHGTLSFGTYNTSYQTEHAWIPHGGGGNSYCGLCDDGGCYHGSYVSPVSVGSTLYKISMQVQPNQAGPQGYMTYLNRRDDSTGSQASGTVTTVATTGNDPLYLGINEYGNNVSDDFEWDNWRVRKYSAIEPTSSVSATEEVSSAPIAYWKFDEGTGTTTYDSSSSGLNGTISGATWAPEDQCISGKCLKFQGNNSISAGNNSSFNVSYSLTVETWIKFNLLDYTNNTGILNWFGSKGNPDQVTPHNGWWFTYDNRNNASNFRYTCFGNVNGGYGGGNNNLDVGNYTFKQGNWYHLGFTVTDTQAKLYINGKQFGSTRSINGLQLSDLARTLSIGGGFNGYLDEYKIYDYARTTAQIKSDYTAGLAHSSTNKGTSASLGSSNKNNDFLSNGLVGYWKMDENTGTNIADSSGNNNTGNFGAGSSAPGWISGKFGIGTNFDGIDNYIDAGNVLNMGTNDMTISTWVKTASSTNQVIVSKALAGAQNYRYSIGTDGNFAKLFMQGDGGADIVTTGNQIINDNKWHLITYIFDRNDKASIYVDGVYNSGQTISQWNGKNMISTNPFRIGAYTAADNIGITSMFNGSLDEIRVYNRALSPSEVSMLYNWAPGPTSYWDFNENTGNIVNDKSGNNKTLTTYNSPLWNQGKYGSGLNFNGSNQYARRTGDSSFNMVNGQAITVSAWVYPRRLGGQYQDIVANRSAAGYNWILYQHTTDGSIQFHGSAQNKSTYIPPLNQWTFISATVDSTGNYYLYANGILVQSLTGYQYSSSVPGELSIGNYASNEHYLGKIDEVKIYNYARTNKQIIEDINGGHPIGGSPVGSQIAYYKFDEGYGTLINNFGNQGNLLNANFGAGSSIPSWSNDGKYNKALNFATPNSYATVSNSSIFNNSTGFTASAWIKSNNIAQDQTILSANGPFFLRLSGSRFRVGILTNSTWTFINGTIPLSSNTWYHLTLTYDGTTMKSYVNGVLDTNNPKTGNLISFAPIYIGYPVPGGENYSFNGLIDEIKIYNSGLTSDEIKIDYNHGASLQLGSLSSGTGNTAPSTAASQEYCVPGDTVSCAPPIGEWKMDEKTGTAAYDTSGNNNVGTINTATWAQGKTGSGINFNGATGSVATPLSFSSLTSYTAEAWVKANNITGSGEHASYGFTVLAASQDSGNLPLWLSVMGNEIRTVNYGNAAQVTSGANITTGKWYHIAVTAVQSGNVQVFVNGLLKGTFTSGTTAMLGNLTIGDLRPGRNINFDGVIDQVKVYNYIRTPAQITWDYNRGGPVGWWKLDECQGTTAHDWSGFSNNGAINIGTSGSQTAVGTCSDNLSTSAWNNGKIGKNNSSLNLDGNDDYFRTGTIPASDNFSFSVWFKAAQIRSNDRIYWGSGSDKAILAFSGTSGNMTWYMSAAGGNTGYKVSSRLIKLTGWNHVVLTYNGASVKCFINGIEDNVTGTLTGISPASAINLGTNYNTSANWFNGQIDDVRAFNYPLTPTQIKTLYNNGAVSFSN